MLMHREGHDMRSGDARKKEKQISGEKRNEKREVREQLVLSCSPCPP